MNFGRKIVRLFGWIVVILLQAIMGMFVVFLLSRLFPAVKISTRSEWLLVLFAIWFGFTIGVYLAGWVAQRLGWFSSTIKPLMRLTSTALGCLLPSVVLTAIGLPYDPGVEGGEFSALILNHWQPILLQLSLLTGILGFYLPTWICSKASAKP